MKLARPVLATFALLGVLAVGHQTSAEAGEARDRSRTAPGEIGPDGMPINIPPPNGTRPAPGEFDREPREVTVKGSSALGCETKMVREWLRVFCTKKGRIVPMSVKTAKHSGQIYGAAMEQGGAKAVVQVVRGGNYQADFAFDEGGSHFGASLFVSWPNGQAKPTFSMQRQ